MMVPAVSRAFLDFSQLLRTNGFAISPDQSMDFLRAIGVLGPDSIEDIYRSALAVFAIAPEQRDLFDALFRAQFMGEEVPTLVSDDQQEEETEAHDPMDGSLEVNLIEDDELSGQEMSRAEVLSLHQFSSRDATSILDEFARSIRDHLPLRQTHRYKPKASARKPDLRRSLRESVRRDGEVLKLHFKKRKSRQRRLVLILDISGSMKEQSEEMIRFSHTLFHAAESAEIFTLGTRLTRITPALAHKNEEVALTEVSKLVADFEGGTRIGETLASLLAVPKYTSMLRGALVVIVSDGLERGDPSIMVQAVQRLARSSWRLDWLTPLASDRGYRPGTRAMMECEPWLNSIWPAGNLEQICHYFLTCNFETRRQAA